MSTTSLCENHFKCHTDLPVQSLILFIVDFREVLAELESTIPSAEFLAIDGEFTGLHNTGQNINAFVDT